MKGLLRLVAPYPVHCRSALLTPHRRSLPLTRQLSSPVSSRLSLSSALWTCSDAGEKKRSARVRPRSASLKKSDVQPLDDNVQPFYCPPAPPPAPRTSYGAPNMLGVYSPKPNVYSPSAGAAVMYNATRDSFKIAAAEQNSEPTSREPPRVNPDGVSGVRDGLTAAPPTISQQTMDEGKLSVSIDFGESSAPDSLPNRS